MNIQSFIKHNKTIKPYHVHSVWHFILNLPNSFHVKLFKSVSLLFFQRQLFTPTTNTANNVRSEQYYASTKQQEKSFVPVSLRQKLRTPHREGYDVKLALFYQWL